MATAVLDNYYLYRKTSGTGRLPLTSPTALLGAGSDSGISSLTSIGFTFNFNDSDWTKFAASTDGFMEFAETAGALGGVDYTNDLVEVNTRILLCPWWDDLRTTAGGDGVRYELQGDVGSRRLIVDFDVGVQYNDDVPRLRFQVVLYEGTNRIEFRYDTPASTDATSTSSASCGVKIAISSVAGNMADGKFRDFIGRIDAPYSTENNARGGWSEIMKSGMTVKIPNNELSGRDSKDYPGDPNNQQTLGVYYFLFSPDEVTEGAGGGGDEESGGGGAGSSSTARYSTSFVDNDMVLLKSQYDKSTDFIPFRLKVRGPSNLRSRGTVYKVTKE